MNGSRQMNKDTPMTEINELSQQLHIPALQVHPIFPPEMNVIIELAAPIVKYGKNGLRVLSIEEYNLTNLMLECNGIIRDKKFCTKEQQIKLRNKLYHIMILIKQLIDDEDKYMNTIKDKPKHFIEASTDRCNYDIKFNDLRSTKQKYIIINDTINKKDVIRDIYENSLYYHFKVYHMLMKMDKIPLFIYNFYITNNNIHKAVNKRDDGQIYITMANMSNNIFVCKNKKWYYPNRIVYQHNMLMFATHDKDLIPDDELSNDFVISRYTFDTSIYSSSE
jgi:hypothetical protein